MFILLGKSWNLTFKVRRILFNSCLAFAPRAKDFEALTVVMTMQRIACASRFLVCNWIARLGCIHAASFPRRRVAYSVHQKPVAACQSKAPSSTGFKSRLTSRARFQINDLNRLQAGCERYIFPSLRIAIHNPLVLRSSAQAFSRTEGSACPLRRLHPPSLVPADPCCSPRPI